MDGYNKVEWYYFSQITFIVTVLAVFFLSYLLMFAFLILLVCYQRNPGIKLYGLPWTFPGWIGGGVFNPFINRTATVRYIMNWIQGAWQQHGLTIDYIGVCCLFAVCI